MAFMDNINIPRSVQRALIGEVPPTLRFLYAYLKDSTLYYHAVFTDEASDDDLECASVALSEVIADCPPDIELIEIIERNSKMHWKIGAGENILYLRSGEYSAT